MSSVYKSSFVFFFFISPRVWGKKASWKVQGTTLVPSHFPETSHQGLHALSLVGFICYHHPSNFVHVVEAKSEVFTADKAEHSLVKVVIVLLKEVERNNEQIEINTMKEK